MPSTPVSGFGLSDALPYLSAVVTGLLGFFGAQFTAVARLQKTLLDASRQYVDQSQAQHARDGARILELEAEIIRQRGEINQHIQTKESLQHALERAAQQQPAVRPRRKPPRPRTPHSKDKN